MAYRNLFNKISVRIPLLEGELTILSIFLQSIVKFFDSNDSNEEKPTSPERQIILPPPPALTNANTDSNAISRANDDALYYFNISFYNAF